MLSRYTRTFKLELNYGECVLGRLRHHATGRRIKRDLYLFLLSIYIEYYNFNTVFRFLKCVHIFWHPLYLLKEKDC
jgi:hypothetical protein